jgi:hypothetical protein
MTGAERTRRYRQRIREAVQLVTLPVSASAVYTLARLGFLPDVDKRGRYQASRRTRGLGAMGRPAAGCRLMMSSFLWSNSHYRCGARYRRSPRDSIGWGK